MGVDFQYVIIYNVIINLNFGGFMEMHTGTVTQDLKSVDVFFRLDSMEKSELLDLLNGITASKYIESGMEQDRLSSFLRTTYNVYFNIASSKATLIKVNVPLNYLVLLRTYAKRNPHSLTDSLVNSIKVLLNSLYGSFVHEQQAV